MDKELLRRVKRRERKRVARSFRVAGIVACVIFGIYAISLIYPLVWGLAMSLKSKTDYITDRFSFPTELHFENYLSAFQELTADGQNMFVMLFNSVWYSVGATFLSVLVSSMTAYAVAKYKFFGRKFLFWAALIALILPVMGNLPAQYKVSVQLGLYDSPWTILASAGAMGTNFMILYSFFKSLDWGYAEAAFIDGASNFRVFATIMVPLAISPIAALALVEFTGRWADAMQPLMFLPSYPTLASGLYIYQEASSRVLNYPVLFAGLFMANIPIFVLYICFQDVLMDLRIGGGIKG